ncbi:hypothetical protein BDV28DRAFT_26696 [Aspergillus coremiiformis]|uniref:Uncharacterized protein n=1 Tax=Aspergillus coremiiformis TaxID=138285 RepID=A0A5N6Z028_9EURO|nr:hypothetical protein BDV28DRAFT_26696 [Aspergillus coremiiformis]
MGWGPWEPRRGERDITTPLKQLGNQHVRNGTQLAKDTLYYQDGRIRHSVAIILLFSSVLCLLPTEESSEGRSPSALAKGHREQTVVTKSSM